MNLYLIKTNLIILIFLVSLTSFKLSAQKRIPVDLVFDFNDAVASNSIVFLGQSQIETGTLLRYMEEGSRPFEGFQFIEWINHKVPIHLERDDSFDIILGLDYNSYEFYYAGMKGAIKNNYLLDRYNILLELETDSLFINSSKEKVQEIIRTKKDSLIAQAKALAVSEAFLKDENKFWNYYSIYHKVFYDYLRSNQINYMDVDLSEFQGLDYSLRDDHFNYSHYLTLSVVHYFQEINKQPDYKSMRNLTKEISSRYVKDALVKVWTDQIYMRQDGSSNYMRLVKRFSSDNISTVKKIYNKRKRLDLGDAFPSTKFTDFFDKTIELEKAKGKSAYVLLYHPNHQDLKSNFLKWNQFYLDHKEDQSRFITIGLGTNDLKDTFKNLFLNNQIVGSHLSTSQQSAFQLLKDLSIGYAPTVLKLDQDFNIIDFNAFPELERSHLFNGINNVKPYYEPQLGAGF